MRRVLRIAAIAAGLSGAVLAGCASGQRADVAADSAAPTSIRAMVVDPHNTEPSREAVDAFLHLAATEPPEELRVFRPSEQEYARLSPAERQALLEQYLEQSKTLRALSRASIARAANLRERNQLDEAASIVDAVERIAAANTGGPETIVLMGNMIGEAIQRSVVAERAALTSASGGAAE